LCKICATTLTALELGRTVSDPPEPPHLHLDQTSPTARLTSADIVAEMDYRIGQIVDCVDEAEIADNTVIVFSSDNMVTPSGLLRDFMGTSINAR
jgi:arylsulfatase A-like enzyme